MQNITPDTGSALSWSYQWRRDTTARRTALSDILLASSQLWRWDCMNNSKVLIQARSLSNGLQWHTIVQHLKGDQTATLLSSSSKHLLSNFITRTCLIENNSPFTTTPLVPMDGTFLYIYFFLDIPLTILAGRLCSCWKNSASVTRPSISTLRAVTSRNLRSPSSILMGASPPWSTTRTTTLLFGTTYHPLIFTHCANLCWGH